MATYKAISLPLIKHKSLYNLTGSLQEVEDERLLEMREIAKNDIQIILGSSASESELIRAVDEIKVILRSIDISDIIFNVGDEPFISVLLDLSHRNGKLRELADVCLESLTFQGEVIANHLIEQKFIEREHLILSSSVVAQKYIDITEAVCRISEYSRSCRDYVMKRFSINEVLFRIKIYEGDPRLTPLMKLITSYAQFKLDESDADICYTAFEYGISANMKELLPIIASGVYRLISNSATDNTLVKHESIFISLLKRNGENREADEFIYLFAGYVSWYQPFWSHFQISRIYDDIISTENTSLSSAAAWALGNMAKSERNLLQGIEIDRLFQILYLKIQLVSYDQKTNYLYSILCISSVCSASFLTNEWIYNRQVPILDVFTGRLSDMYKVAIDSLILLAEGMVAAGRAFHFYDELSKNGAIDVINEIVKDDEIDPVDKERLSEIIRYLNSNK